MNRRQLENTSNRYFFGPCELRPHFRDDGEKADGFSVTVVFTTVAATLMALRRAGELARELNARIRILMPHVVPYPLPIDRPPVDPEFKLRHFRTITADDTIETSIDVRLCRNSDDAVKQALCPQSVVLIGGPRRFWPTRETRLARKLSVAGHHVIFVPQY